MIYLKIMETISLLLLMIIFIITLRDLIIFCVDDNYYFLKKLFDKKRICENIKAIIFILFLLACWVFYWKLVLVFSKYI